MDRIALEPSEALVLKHLGPAPGGRLSGGKLGEKLWPKSKRGPAVVMDRPEADRVIAGLIDRGLIEVDGGSKEDAHPRKGATYRLSEGGKQHLRPARPDIPETQLRAQEAFILLQLFRAKEGKSTRAELNRSLGTRTAIGQLEFDIKGAPETVDYHLAALVEGGGVIEDRRSSTSVSYRLDSERGLRALAGARQHDAVTFNLRGDTLNALLEAARRSAPTPTADRVEPPPRPELDAGHVEAFLGELSSDRFAGKDLIPIHEVRRLVRERLGDEAAGHPVFDPLLRRLRGEGRLRLLAITDSREVTQEQLDASIPGMNETLFYIDIG